MTRDELMSGLRALVREDDDTHDEAFDLWSWLPSHAFAEAAHGDYAAEFTPPPAAVMQEASSVMAWLAGYASKLDTDDDRAVFGCACGECETPTRGQIEAELAKIGKPVQR